MNRQLENMVQLTATNMLLTHELANSREACGTCMSHPQCRVCALYMWKNTYLSICICRCVCIAVVCAGQETEAHKSEQGQREARHVTHKIRPSPV